MSGHEERVEALLEELVSTVAGISFNLPAAPDLGTVEARLLRIEDYLFGIYDALTPDNESETE